MNLFLVVVHCKDNTTLYVYSLVFVNSEVDEVYSDGGVIQGLWWTPCCRARQQSKYVTMVNSSLSLPKIVFNSMIVMTCGTYSKLSFV